jgi:predicted phage terminase large subunit-like protein
LSIDCSFKDAAGSDSVSLQLWGSHQTNEYLVCDWNDRMSFTDTVSAVKRILAGGAPECLVSKYRVGAKLVEDKANGAAVMNVLQKEVPGLIPITPEGGKIARANAVSWLHQAGNVWYPNPKLIGVTWATPHINQIIGFPKARKDDSTDAETQFLTYRHRNGSNLWAAIEAHRQKSRLTTT